jgi:hypothetical protein
MLPHLPALGPATAVTSRYRAEESERHRRVGAQRGQLSLGALGAGPLGVPLRCEPVELRPVPAVDRPAFGDQPLVGDAQPGVVLADPAEALFELRGRGLTFGVQCTTSTTLF